MPAQIRTSRKTFQFLRLASVGIKYRKKEKEFITM